MFRRQKEGGWRVTEQDSHPLATHTAGEPETMAAITQLKKKTGSGGSGLQVYTLGEREPTLQRVNFFLDECCQIIFASVIVFHPMIKP
jgi:hypothetical protein